MENLAVSATAITAITPACTGSVTTRSACIWYAAGHIQADDQCALRSDFTHRRFDVAAHQRAGQNKRPHSGQAPNGADRVRQRFLPNQRYGVDRNVLASNVVAVGFRDRAHRNLAHLSAAAHDDDALAVDFLKRLHNLRGANHLQLRQIAREFLG